MLDLTEQNIISRAKKVIEQESEALLLMCQRIDSSFMKACKLILNCHARVVVLGMGKSGHIGSKIAATLASTGTPAFFVHPGEASHGDLGMITKNDVVLMLSYSGETQEMLSLLPALKRMGAPLIAMTGNPLSMLARNANAHLNIQVEREACALNLAPTTSTTAMLVMGDALAVSLLETRGFSKEDFAFSHPGGSLGRRLLLTVADIMHKEHEVPTVSATTTLQDTLFEMTRGRLGMTAVIDASQIVLGIFTDGDLRRVFKNGIAMTTPIQSLMNTQPKVIQAHVLAAEALRMMDETKINALLVIDESRKLIGALNMHDLLKAGII